MEIQGKIIVIGELQTIGAKGFRKQQIVVKTDSQYPQSIPIEFTQDNILKLANYKVDDYVNVKINVNGAEWKGKYYVNLNGWSISGSEKEKSALSFMPDREPVYRAVPKMNGDMANQFNESQEKDF